MLCNTGDISRGEIGYICERLLADPVIQSYRINNRLKKSGFSVAVRLKRGITDPLSGSILKGIADLGIRKKVSVKTSKRYLLRGTLSRKDVLKVVKKLITNELLHVYSICVP